MAIICRSIQMLFIMAPRTGCSAVGRVLREELGGAWLPESDIVDGRGLLVVGKKHCTLAQLLDHRILVCQDASSLFKVTCVRNPFDSLVSLYMKRRNFPQERLEDPSFWMHRVPSALREVEFCRAHSFGEWIRYRYRFRSLAAALGVRRRGMLARYTDGADFVMRFENLQHDFDVVLRRVGVDRSITIPRINPTQARDAGHRGYYDARTRRLVERVFRADLERFRYAF